MDKIKIGVIGTGRIGQMHVENLANMRDNFEVTAIADPYAPNLAELAQKYQIPHYTNDYEKVLADPQIQAVVIASATNTHATIIKAAAKQNKSIFCEKPLAEDVPQIKQLLQVVKDNGTCLQVGFNRRFDHNFKQIHDYVKAGQIGTPQIIKISSRDPEPPSIDYVKVSGGLFNDMMIHDFDMARYLSDSEVVEVNAQGAVLVNPEIGEVGDIDTAIVTLKFANGALGVIDNSRQAVYGYDQRAEVFGSKGQAVSTNDRLNNVELDQNENVQLSEIPFFFIERYQQAYRDEFQAFYEAVTKKQAPVVDGLDGLKAVEIARACDQSLKTHQAVKL